ncbi:hypothetical protein HDV03_005119 [Kappamyces sp. JEL0829]|nr:hypothetical protein HDV03_005119 [Kappamyces sp. JEL0829]
MTVKDNLPVPATLATMETQIQAMGGTVMERFDKMGILKVHFPSQTFLSNPLLSQLKDVATIEADATVSILGSDL